MPRWKSLTALLRAIDRKSYIPFPSPLSVHSRRADGDTPLHVAVGWDDVEAVDLLIRSGAEVDAAGDLDSTPLYTAVLSQHLAAARSLMSAGASPHRSDQFGRSPIALAMRSDHPEMVALAARMAAGPDSHGPPNEE